MLYSGARILIESLIEHGVDTVFGYPGSAVLHIYDELYKQRGRIRHILVSHEQHAAHAADGYARASGKPGVCIATSGPGATNLISGIAAAYMDSSPLVAITGNVATTLLGKDSFQEVDIAGVSMPVVKHNWIVKDVDELAEVIREAFIVALSGRPGPVLIDIPKDVTAQSAEWIPSKRHEGVNIHDDTLSARAKRLTEKSRRKSFSDDDIERAAAFLRKAKRPLIYAGGGVISANAGKELKSLAERLNAPVALSLMGTGAMPRSHKLCTGLIGMHGSAASNRAARKADLIMAIGARFSDRVVCKPEMFAKNVKVLHFDIDAAEINKNMTANASVIGNVKETLALLLEKIAACADANAGAKPAAETESGWRDDIEKWKARDIKAAIAARALSAGKSSTSQKSAGKKMSAEKSALAPAFVIEETAKKLGTKLIAVTDVGQHQVWAAQYFPAEEPRSFISSGGLGCMGFGLGASIGAKLANPGRPVTLFTGDGCFKMNSGELATLKAFKIPVLIVIFSNGVLGMVRQWQSAMYEGRHSETVLSPYPDFIKLSGAYGIAGFRAANRAEFLTALNAAATELAAGRASVIEAAIGRDEKVSPMYI